MANPIDTKHCFRCDTDKPLDEWYLNKGRSDGLSGYCIVCFREINNDLYQKNRAELLEAAGGQCAIPDCPNDDPRGWCVDHVNGNGKVERDSLGVSSRAFIKRVQANPDDYQVLCAYHNQIKRVEEKESVGRRVYTRKIPTEKVIGPGRWPTKD